MGVFLTCSCKKEFKTRGRSAVKGVGSNSSETCYFDVVEQTKYFPLLKMTFISELSLLTKVKTRITK